MKYPHLQNNALDASEHERTENLVQLRDNLVFLLLLNDTLRDGGDDVRGMVIGMGMVAYSCRADTRHQN
jgi:hypothetical protein